MYCAAAINESDHELLACFTSEVTYPIHVEAINTLLVMLSVQMFDPGASHSSIFYQVIMKGKW